MKDFKELSLELTDCCPLSCMHCSSNSDSLCNDCLPNDIVKKLVDEAVSIGANKISLGGGEPAIAKNFLSVLSYLSTKNISVEVFTSGVTNFNNKIERYSNDLIETISSFDNLKLIFSIYGANQEVHDNITRIPGSFKATLISLKKCLSAQIKCEVNYVPLKVNSHDFEDLINLIESYGLDKISILRFVPQGRGHENRDVLEMSAEEEDAFVANILHLREVKNFQIRTGSPFNGIVPGNKVPCRAGFAKLVVQANGNVLPCEVFKHHERCNWNLSVYKHSLNDILASKQVTTLRNRLRKSNCLKCPIHSSLRSRLCEGAISV